MDKLLNQLTIKLKVLGNSLLLLVLIAANSGYALYAMSQIGSELEAIADPQPNGCVDCHKVDGANDYRLSTELAKMEHINVNAMVNTVPLWRTQLAGE